MRDNLKSGSPGRAVGGAGVRLWTLARYSITWQRLRFSGLNAPDLVYIDPRARLCPPKNVTLEASCLLGNVYVYALAPVRIGRHAIVNDGVFLCTASHDHGDPDFALTTGAITVGDHAWVATNATVMPGVTIGRGAVVAAGAMVTRDVPEMTVVGGNPAREIGKRKVLHGDGVTARLSSTDFRQRLAAMRGSTHR